MGFTDKMIQAVFERVSGETVAISRDASTHSVSSWKRMQIVKGATVGALAAVIPGGGYVTIPADLMYGMRLMHRTATGICAIELGHADDDSFAGVLAVWSGTVVLSSAFATQISAKMMAKAAARSGGIEGVKIAIKAISTTAGIVFNSQLAPKVAASVATKLTGKVGAKTLTRWIPVVSAVVGGAANAWMLNSIADATEQYAQFVRARIQKS